MNVVANVCHECQLEGGFHTSDCLSRGRKLTDAVQDAKPRPLEWLAIEVAVAAPEEFSQYGDKAYIPRALIKQIRAELDQQHVDWRKIRRERQAARHR